MGGWFGRWTGESAVRSIRTAAVRRCRATTHLVDSGRSPILGGIGHRPWVWGKNAFEVWMLFVAPLLAGGAGAAIRPMVDRQRGTQTVAPVVLVTVVLGLVAGGIAGVLFVTAQLTANPDLIAGSALDKIISYAQRSIPFAVGVGFVAGLTSDVVFGKLLGLDVVRGSGIANTPERTH
jgi:hypothetical protein